MKKTLLQIVQDILEEIDSDPVNSISDTIESAQVATIVKNCYFYLMSTRNWAHQRKMFQLDSAASLTKPVYLKIPEDVKEIETIKYKAYDTTGRYLDLKYKTPDDFLRYVFNRSLERDGIISVTDYSGVSLLIDKKTAPQFWTSIDDKYIILDAYDYTKEDTVNASKTLCIGFKEPSWTHEDSFVPDLPTEAFTALYEEAKSTASLDLKQIVNQKAEAKAAKGRRRASNRDWTAHDNLSYPNYGRRSRK